MPWISNHKHEIEEKSLKGSRSSSKVVGLGPADQCEFPTLVSTGPDNGLVLNRQQAITSTIGEQVSWYQEDHNDWSNQLGLGKSTACKLNEA